MADQISGANSQSQKSKIERPFHPLPESFYLPSAEIVAPKLLGHWLMRRTPHGICGGPIVETEAYLVGDEACHSFGGMTDRNKVMFGPPGFVYVYFIYGNHFCVNAVCCREGKAEAVLIRAVEAEFGEEIMRANRPVTKLTELTNGPGKLCQAMKIERKENGVSLCDPESELIIARNPKVKQFVKERGPIVASARIGITRAAHLPLRFCLAGSRFVSRPVRAT